ncbi:hypothetical protein [Timonella senegalensis]|uniref:hypothetical protein n=1 Tax=Timonella senegalensis TaxID=1465825 RepID=UPI0028A71930|nr:hypothetical protein [Timonella senegalensis]
MSSETFSPYTEPEFEPFDGRASQPVEQGDQDYPETLESQDPLHKKDDEYRARDMHEENEDFLGEGEEQEGLDAE